jgi:phosphatidylserine decarboxylase
MMIATCLASGALVLLLTLAYVFWRKVWFFRNPPRNPPPGESILSPADGTVVYVQTVPPQEPVISIKMGVRASVNDIVREHLDAPKVLIGVFMSPYNVHYNRAPLSGQVQSVSHHPAHRHNRHMGMMHWRTLLKKPPYHQDSLHILDNERTVTRIDGQHRGQDLSCYVVQIGARTVHGIDSYVHVGQRVSRGDTFGMIRIGSQVDLVVPWREGMTVRVRPGQRVRAGETVLIDFPTA